MTKFLYSPLYALFYQADKLVPDWFFFSLVTVLGFVHFILTMLPFLTGSQSRCIVGLLFLAACHFFSHVHYLILNLSLISFSSRLPPPPPPRLFMLYWCSVTQYAYHSSSLWIWASPGAIFYYDQNSIQPHRAFEIYCALRKQRNSMAIREGKKISFHVYASDALMMISTLQ